MTPRPHSIRAALEDYLAGLRGIDSNLSLGAAEALGEKALADLDGLLEQVETLREECADWERGADEELARAWKERALASEEQLEAQTARVAAWEKAVETLPLGVRLNLRSLVYASYPASEPESS